jgi:hypothetical protein
MSAIDKLVTATNALAEVQIKVEDEHLGTIYVKPAISCAKANEIQNVKEAEGKIKGICLEVIYRVCDESGAPMFQKADLVKMMQEIDGDIITGIYLAMKAEIYSGKSTAATSSTTS